MTHVIKDLGFTVDYVNLSLPVDLDYFNDPSDPEAGIHSAAGFVVVLQRSLFMR